MRRLRTTDITGGNLLASSAGGLQDSIPKGLTSSMSFGGCDKVCAQMCQGVAQKRDSAFFKQACPEDEHKEANRDTGTGLQQEGREPREAAPREAARVKALAGHGGEVRKRRSLLTTFSPYIGMEVSLAFTKGAVGRASSSPSLQRGIRSLLPTVGQRASLGLFSSWYLPARCSMTTRI